MIQEVTKEDLWAAVSTDLNKDGQLEPTPSAVEPSSEPTSNQPQSDSASEKQRSNHEWETAPDFQSASMHAYGFGFTPIPIWPGTNRTAVNLDEWQEGLGVGKIVDYWNKHPDHELAFIVGDDIIVFDADSPEAIDALKAIEERFGLTPKMVVKTSSNGEYHCYRRAAGTVAKSDSHSTEKYPDRLDIKTGRAIAILPPSTGKSFLVKEAETKEELSEITREAIDAVNQHNGRSVPLQARAVVPRGTEDDTTLPEIDALLEPIDPDIGYQDWLRAGMAVYHATRGSKKGLATFDRWSSRGRKYKGIQDIKTKWRSFRLDVVNPVTIATLVKMAKDTGADVATIMKKDGFEPCEFEVVPPSVEAAPVTTALVCAAPTSLEPSNPDGQLEPCKQVVTLDNAKSIEISKFPNPPSSNSNTPPATIANIAYLLAWYGVTVRYNVIKKKLIISMPYHTGTTDNMDNVMMAYIINLVSLNGMAIGQVPAIVEVLADRNMHNPVADWIKSKPWDGKDRRPDICDTITVREGYPIELRDVLIWKWLLSAVAAVLMPNGFKARGVLTFQGAQSIGKTSWVLSLVSDLGLRDMVVKVDHHMDGSNKDSIIGAICHWIVEIGELEGSFKKDITRLKGILTSNSDKVRRPYARTESEYQRRTVFMATVNQPDFLVDNTGNSRWWTIPVTEINYTHGIDMQQVFAQLAVIYNEGAQWWLTREEEALLEIFNRDHRSMSVIRELFLEKIDQDLIGKEGNPAKTAIEVLRDLGYKDPKTPQCKECAGILREMLGESKKINGYQKWRIPFKRHSGPITSINDLDDKVLY